MYDTALLVGGLLAREKFVLRKHRQNTRQDDSLAAFMNAESRFRDTFMF